MLCDGGLPSLPLRCAGVDISEGALVAAAALSARYISGRYLPDKAIDLMDEATAQARLRARA